MRTAKGGVLRLAVAVAGACLAITVAPGSVVRGQLSSVSGQVQHARGQYVAPVYEGWYRTPDGAINVSFGYLNKNYEETLDIPIGPANRIEPGPADQGQPTHFLPRRQYGVFVVTLPKDQPKTEIAWTLTMRGRTESVPANLGNLYMIDALEHVGGTDEGSTPPVLSFAPAAKNSAVGPAGLTTALDAVASRPLPLQVWVADRGPTRVGTQAPVGTSEPSRPNTRSSASVTWSQYRGSGQVRFTDSRPKIEQGTATTAVTFTEPGEYMLRVVAMRGSGLGSQCCWTNGYVKVNVGRAR